MGKLLRNSALLLACCLVWLCTQAQEAPSQEQTVQQTIEYISENLDQQADFTDVTYWLNYYYQHPLDLNKASREELAQLYLLTAPQIESLIEHREQFGKLISIYELQAVEDFDLQTITRILPFVQVEETSEQEHYTLKQALTQGEQDVSLRYTQIAEPQQGYRYTNPEKRYLGSPYGLQLRYEYRLGNRLSYGLVADKDPGEQFFRGHEKQGFDFYSAHLFYSGYKHLRSLALGDYQVQIGQGLTMWSSFALGKTAEVMNMARQPRGIFPSRSSNAFMFLRGAAASFAFGRWGITAFASRKKLDANALKDTAANAIDGFSSLLISGYHRSLSELEDRNTLTETMAGGALGYDFKSLHIGWCTVYGRYDLPMQKDASLYSAFNIKQGGFFTTGLNYTWLYRNAYFFGEVAWNGRGGAGISGAMLSLHSSLDVGLLYRNYSKSYGGPYVNALADGSQNSNERGTYLALSYRPASAWQLNAYADFFSSPWLRYRVDAPSAGQDFLLYLTYQPSKVLQAYVRYRMEHKELNATGSPDKMNMPVFHSLQHLRMQLQYQLRESLMLRSRIELSQYQEENQKLKPGFLAFQDVDIKPFKRLTLSARYTFFDISDYSARIYAYEEDMPFSFSIPSFQGQGIRYYLLAAYHCGSGLDISARLARTRLYDVSSIGSGTDMISFPHKTELKLELRWQF